MRPIQYRAEIALSEAMLCVEYRLPPTDGFRRDGYFMALALRYGLVATAAAHHLLQTTHQDEQAFLLQTLEGLPGTVLYNLRSRVLRSLPDSLRNPIPAWFGVVAEEPVTDLVGQYPMNESLELSLSRSVGAFERRHQDEILNGWNAWRKRAAMTAFRDQASLSMHFALAHYDRRMADLPEVPEIALLGE